MEKINYSVLVHKQVTGVITSEESALLNDWLVEDHQHSLLADEIRGIWLISQTKMSGWEPDVEDGLVKLKQRIAEDENNTKTIRRPVVFSILRYAAAAIFLVSLVYFVRGVGSPAIEWQIAETATNEIKTITLEDNSQVTLNGGTYFSFPNEFEANSRIVRMDGEGFFEIARDEARPFSIEMDHGTVRVLGTSFNITNAPEANTTTISVATGKVAFIPKGSKQEFILEVNDKLIYNANTQQYRKVKDLSPNEWSWKTKELVFQDTKLEEVIPAIEKYFDIRLSLANAQLADCRNLTATFTDASKMDVLSALTLTVGVDIKKAKEADTFVLFGGSCE